MTQAQELRISGTNYRIFYSLLAKLYHAAKESKKDGGKPLDLNVVFTFDECQRQVRAENKSVQFKLRRAEYLLRKPYTAYGALITGTTQEFQAFSHVEYKDCNIYATFSREVIPYLDYIIENFVDYNLETVGKFNSYYAIKIFELMHKYRDQGQARFPAAELRDHLLVPDHVYLRNELYSQCLKPAIKKINALQNIQLKVNRTYGEEGITEVKFYFDNKAKDLDISTAPSIQELRSRFYIKNLKEKIAKEELFLRNLLKDSQPKPEPKYRYD